MSGPSDAEMANKPPQRDEQIVAILEIAVDGAAGHADALGYGLKGRVLETALPNELAGGVQQGGTGTNALIPLGSAFGG